MMWMRNWWRILKTQTKEKELYEKLPLSRVLILK
jgi:hypothetical protein